MKVKLKMSMFRIVCDENYSKLYEDDYATFVYVALRCLCKNNIALKTTINGLYQTLSDSEPTRENIKGIKDGLQALSDQGFISFEKKGMTYSIYPLNIDIDTQIRKYFYVSMEYIKKIMNTKSGVKLLHHYLLLCSTINVKNNTGNHGEEYFSTELNTCLNTISNQRKKFSELGVLCFSDARSKKLPTGEWINIPKVYTMPENKELIPERQADCIDNETKKVIKSKKKSKKEFEDTAIDKVQEMKMQQELEKNNDNPFGDIDTNEQYKKWLLNDESIAEIKSKHTEPPKYEETDIANIF